MVPADAREKMIRELTMAQKWTFLAQQERRNTSGNASKERSSVKTTPDYMIGQLFAKPTVEIYRALRVCLTTEPVAWLQAFFDKGGVELLVQTVMANEKVKDKSGEVVEMICEGLNCVVAMSHTGDGLALVLNTLVERDLIKQLVLCLDTRDSRVKIVLYDFLSLLCALDEAFFELVMEAMDSYRYVKHESSKFQHLVDTLRFDVEAPKSHCLQFVNALISTSENLDRRCVTRAMFDRLGLAEVLARLSKTQSSNEALMIHYNTYVEEEKSDLAAREELRKNLEDELEKHKRPRMGFSYAGNDEKASDWTLLFRRIELHSSLKPHLDAIGKVQLLVSLFLSFLQKTQRLFWRFHWK